MHALIMTYTDSEVTYWYTKFSYRYAAAYVMEYIWQDAGYRKSFVELQKNHSIDFNAFCNLLINDINSLLFDGLLALEEIKRFEDERDDAGFWGSLGEDEKQAKESNYAEKTRSAKAWLQLSNMVIQLLAKVTLHCPEPFISDELGKKFAEATNFCLDQLCSEKGLRFKIKNPERFHFEPKELLTNLIQMYTNMANLHEFHVNIVSD